MTPPAAEDRSADAPAPSPATELLLRFGRFADRTRLLTVGGWGLFGVSTVLGATLAVAPGGSEPATVAAAPETLEEAEPPAPAPLRTVQRERRWPAVPEGFDDGGFGAEGFDPPPADWAEDPPPVSPPFVADAPPAGGEPWAENAPWDAALADLPPAARDDLAAVRDRFGSVTDALPAAPDFLLESPSPALPAAPVALREPAAENPDLAGLRHAAAVCRHNLANAHTPGFRRLEPVTAAVADLGGAAPAGTREAPGPPTDCGAASNVDVPAELARLRAVQDLLRQLGDRPAGGSSNEAAPSRVAARP